MPFRRWRWIGIGIGSTSGAKSDKVDSRTLSDILCVDRGYHRPIPADSPLAQEIQLVSRQRQRLVREQTRLKTSS